jgi:hypothetical protein
MTAHNLTELRTRLAEVASEYQWYKTGAVGNYVRTGQLIDGIMALVLDYDKWAVEQEAFARSEYLRGFDEGVNDG